MALGESSPLSELSVWSIVRSFLLRLCSKRLKNLKIEIKSFSVVMNEIACFSDWNIKIRLYNMIEKSVVSLELNIPPPIKYRFLI